MNENCPKFVLIRNKKMRKLKRYLLLFGLGFGLMTVTQSCKTGEGCDQSGYSAKTDKDGNLSMKRGKSSLFSKKKRKR